MIKHLLCAAAVLAATPALAQEKATFNGFFAGIQGGWQQDRVRQSLDVYTGAGVLTPVNVVLSQAGFAYGGQVGYDMRVGSGVVIGGEVALTGRTGAYDLTRFYDGVDPGFGVGTNNNPIRWTQGLTVGVTGRVGYLVSDTGLGYIRGGYTNTTYIIRDNNNSVSRSQGGFQIGAGFEQYVAQNISVRLEYAYSQYGVGDIAGDAGFDPTDVVTAGMRSRNAVLVGANFRF